jgi:MFS family permease
VGKGIRTPPRDALIADVTPPAQLGRAFGFQRGLDHAGAVLGPLVAWWLLSRRTLDVRGVIEASWIPGIVVLVLAIWAVGDGKGREKADEGGRGRTGPDRGGPDPASSGFVRPRPALLAISAFYLLRMPETLLLLRTQQLGVSVSSVLLLWAALHVVRSFTSFVGGSLSDRFGPLRTMWLGWMCYAAIAVGFALEGSAPAAWGLFLVLGTVAGLTESPERAIVSGLAGMKQGSGFGSYHAATGMAALAGGLLLGTLYQTRGAPLAFIVSAAGVTLAALWVAAAARRRAAPVAS